MTTTVTLIAPNGLPGMTLYGRSGAVYKADASGTIASVNSSDVEPLLGAGCTYPSSSANTFKITNTYTASGAIAVTDTVAVVNSASAVAMTLANGTTDGHAIYIKRLGAGTVTLTVSAIDGTTNAAITMNSNTIKESVSLIWSASLNTWLA